MKTNIGKISLISLFLLTAALPMAAQSRYLDDGIGGSSFGIRTLTDDTGVYSVGLSASYSIGGIMDFGFRLARETGTLETYDKTEWNYSFLYNLIVIKQADLIPFSFQLEGSYGYTNVSSVYLDGNSLTQNSQGFDVAGSLFRLFNSESSYPFLLGAKGKYKNYVLNQYDNTSGIPVLDSSRRNEDLMYGGIASLSYKMDQGPLFTLEVEALYNQTSEKFVVESSLLFTSPSF